MNVNANNTETKKTRRRLLFYIVISFFVVPVILFLPAGSIDYWQAWLYLVSLYIPATYIVIYLWKHDFPLLLRRAKTREKDRTQGLLIQFIKYIFFIGFMICGFDHRYHWSNVPAAAVITADCFVLAGYLLIFLVLKENPYASRIIEVEEGQKVIDTGPYAVVRHPMYSASILIYMPTPLALGSFWALIPFAFLPVLMIFRLLLEEKTLRKNLPGYSEYCQKIRYRLLPFIW